MTTEGMSTRQRWLARVNHPGATHPVMDRAGHSASGAPGRRAGVWT